MLPCLAWHSHILQGLESCSLKAEKQKQKKKKKKKPTHPQETLYLKWFRKLWEYGVRARADFS